MPNAQQASPNKEIGQRLAEERLRLKFTQGELSSLLSTSRNSVTQYEAGNHLPGAEVLVSMHGSGIDILYVLTGQRAPIKEIPIDLGRLALALQEARRQMGLPSDGIGQGEILGRAMIIYSAVGQFLGTQFVKVQ